MGRPRLAEQNRRREIESVFKYANQKIEVDEHLEIRNIVLDRLIMELDGKLANLQYGEGLVVYWSLDIVTPEGKVRGGSGAERNMPQYIEWRRAVYERDDYTCQDCGSTEHLQAHHIKSWSGHPYKRFDISNGMTLCRSCHAKRHPHLKLIQKKSDKRRQRSGNEQQLGLFDAVTGK